MHELVVLETPFTFASFYAMNSEIRYARACVRECMTRREEFPFSAYLLYSQPDTMDTSKTDEHELSLEAGIAWGSRATKTVVYLDLGLTRRLKVAINNARLSRRPIEYRMLVRDSVVANSFPDCVLPDTDLSWLGIDQTTILGLQEAARNKELAAASPTWA